MKALNVLLFSCILAVAVVSAQGSGTAQSGDARTQTTAHYQITLDIGPLSPMLTPDQASTAQTGEVMIAMPGSPMPMMAMTDQGRPVNHHLEVAVTDKATGAPRKSPMPRITITDPATGRSRTLPAVVGMYDLTKGERDVHFGNNVHLADGAYTVTVSVGGDGPCSRRLPSAGPEAANAGVRGTSEGERTRHPS